MRHHLRRGAVVATGLTLISAVIAFAAPASIERGATASEPAVRGPAQPPVSGPSIGGCPVFPPDNPWNTPIADAPLHPTSDAIIERIQSSGGTQLHPDFGENPAYGIPFVVVGPDQPVVPVEYDAYGDESDPGPFPIPLDAPIEGAPGATSGDRHVIALRTGTCELFELYVGRPTADRWIAASGARFDLRSNELRPLGWTSADAAGLPILPGLVRHEEVAGGAIEHAIRVTFTRTRRGYVLPATHFASSATDVDLPPMGLRLRMRADVDLSGVTGQARVIAEAMKEYGLIVADNGSNWFFQGAPSDGWDDDDLGQLKDLSGDLFEVVDTGPVVAG